MYELEGERSAGTLVAIDGRRHEDEVGTQETLDKGQRNGSRFVDDQQLGLTWRGKKKRGGGRWRRGGGGGEVEEAEGEEEEEEEGKNKRRRRRKEKELEGERKRRNMGRG